MCGQDAPAHFAPKTRRQNGAGASGRRGSVSWGTLQ